MAVSFCGKRFLLCKNVLFQSQRKSGYIVLVPEIGEDIPGYKNPLLCENGLPEFNNATIETCVSVINKQCIAYENGVKQIEESSENVKNIIADVLNPLEQLETNLELTWGLAKTLYVGNNILMPTKSYVSIHERANQARLCKYYSKPIFEAIKNAKQTETNLTEEEKRIINKYVLEGKLNGLEMSDKNREKLGSVRRLLAKETKDYNERVNIATKIFSQLIEDQNITRDFPDSLLKSMSSDPNEPTRGPWKATLFPHVYNQFLEYCPDHALRFSVWLGHVQRCSRFAESSIQTSINLETIRGFRYDQAKMLGFDSYVQMSMATKMAGKVENVYNMLNNLLERARPIQDLEIEKLQDFAVSSGFDRNLHHCDVPYWRRKQLKSIHNFDREEVREYFPLPVVLEGLFNLCTKLFDIKILERPKTHTWHEDVKFYDVFEPESSNPIAGFYFDPYTRENEKVTLHKDSGSMISIRNRSNITGTVPLASLIFNFPIPIYGKPSLLSFNEVNSLFYQFGHSLRHLLTEANYTDVAGISNVEWDAVKVCGHVMTHWLYEPHILKSISRHYTTQECLPDNIITSILSTRHHMSAYSLCKELYLSMLDLQLHSTKVFWRDIVEEIWPKYHTIPLDKLDNHPCALPAIVTEGWAAAYYSNLWSRMIAADVYSAFYEVRHDENDILEIGRRYRDTFLASGGTCHPSEVFRRFRGRDPSHKALLHTLGLKKLNEVENKNEHKK